MYEEVGVLPTIFDQKHYDNLSHQELVLSTLRHRLQNTTLIRAVAARRWVQEVSNRAAKSNVSKELLELLTKLGRIIREDDGQNTAVIDWVSCYATSHREREIRAVLADERSGSNPGVIPPVLAVSKLIKEKWWHAPSLTVDVSSETEFIAAIRLGLLRAARIEIADPYLLPTKYQYRSLLPSILQETVRNPRNPLLRIHTSPKAKREDDTRSWEGHFEAVSGPLSKTGRSAQVFVWRNDDLPDGFHDRYLLTEIGSCAMGRGAQVRRGYTSTFYRLDPEKEQRLTEAFRRTRMRHASRCDDSA